ncbi:hypothetical protein H1R20_g7286, partial [Candolleomyces eurysporus]
MTENLGLSEKHDEEDPTVDEQEQDKFPSIKRNEKWVAPLGGRNITGQYDPRVNSYNRNTLVSLVQSEPTELDRRFMQSAQQLNREFPFNLYPNLGDPIGVMRPFIWTRIPSNASIFKEYSEDPSSGENAPHLEIIPGNESNQVLAVVMLLTPKSRGSIRLRSSNPLDPPLIDLGLFKHLFDVETLRIGVSRAVRFFSAPAWSDYITALFTPDPDTTPREIFNEAFIRGMAGSGYHTTGTAAMSARDKLKEGVIGPDLKVKGVKGLRIVDASVIPLIPTGHTQAPVYIVAEHAAELIREA